MNVTAQAVLARRVIIISGVLALLTGLLAIGVQIFAPLVTVQVIGPSGTYVTHESYWEVTGGFILSPLGLVALGLCLVCVFAIGYGAYAFGMRHQARGRLFLWGGTALLALVIALSLMVASYGPINTSLLFPMPLLARYLLPCLGLAVLASGAATTSSQ